LSQNAACAEITSPQLEQYTLGMTNGGSSYFFSTFSGCGARHLSQNFAWAEMTSPQLKQLFLGSISGGASLLSFTTGLGTSTITGVGTSTTTGAGGEGGAGFFSEGACIARLLLKYRTAAAASTINTTAPNAKP
jgi:hypothetical protein